MKFKYFLIVIYFYCGKGSMGGDEPNQVVRGTKRPLEDDTINSQHSSKWKDGILCPKREHYKTISTQASLIKTFCLELTLYSLEIDTIFSIGRIDMFKKKEAVLLMAESYLDKINILYESCYQIFIKHKKRSILQISRYSDDLLKTCWRTLFHKEIVTFDKHIIENGILILSKQREEKIIVDDIYAEFLARFENFLTENFYCYSTGYFEKKKIEKFQIKYLLIAEVFKMQKYFRDIPMLVHFYTIICYETNGLHRFLFVRYLHLIIKEYYTINPSKCKDPKDFLLIISHFIYYIFVKAHNNTPMKYSIFDNIPNPLSEENNKPLLEMCKKSHQYLFNIFILSMPKKYIDMFNNNTGYTSQKHPSNMLKAILCEYLYKHLLLNEMFSFSSFNSLKYTSFIKKLESDVDCYGCLMEDCMSILAS
ncbi:hypothetical protein NGRA_1727 [Nosema granulosis]|uniref:Uncharacterized protein n=1 Tax=Nosema granulosis TaxID=83296 RepID=A0A9P6GYW4_9MICR|nr:hypothetical protein NGRA_1727 [Nosema granulosis]